MKKIVDGFLKKAGIRSGYQKLRQAKDLTQKAMKNKSYGPHKLFRQLDVDRAKGLRDTGTKEMVEGAKDLGKKTLYGLGIGGTAEGTRRALGKKDDK